MGTESTNAVSVMMWNIPFITIIEADHDHLSKLASQIRQLSPSHVVFHTIFAEIVWRLVRHDISEELVMRPAFRQYMGAKGAAIADKDRREHGQIKRQLWGMWRDVSSRSTGNEQNPTFEQDVVKRLGFLLGEMAHHMREEGGEELPRFAQMINQEESLRLGRDYASTLVLTPNLDVEHSSIETPGKSVFSHDQIEAYISRPVESFREQLQEVLHANKEEVVAGLIMKELGTLGLTGFDASGVHDRTALKVNL